MSGVWTRPRQFACAAAMLAVLGALGIGPAWRAAPSAVVVLTDASESCDPSGSGRRFLHSDLNRAVREAAGDGVERVVLYTDGCDTSGEKPAHPGVSVDVVLRPRRDNIGIQQVLVPPRIPPGAPFSVRVVVGRTDGPAAPAATVMVQLARDGERIGSARNIALGRGESRSVAFVDKVPKTGVVHYRARIMGGPGGGAEGAGGEADDAAEATARIGDRPQIAVLGEAPDWGKEFVFSSWPGGLSLDGFDAILIAQALTDRADADAIEGAVRAGAGLLVLGHDALLDSLLPLTDDPPDGRAVVLLVDVSGSMEKHLPAIRAGFLSLASRLAPTDRAALVLFRDQVVHVSPWVDAPEARTLWKSVPARGNTLLAPAAREAIALLGNAQARHRRLYIVSDGEWGDRDKNELAQLLTGAATVHRAALFVSDDTPPAALSLFPVHSIASADSIDAALMRLEQEAPDRRVRGPVEVRDVDGPAWFRDVRSPVPSCSDFLRLYPKGAGESVVVAAGAIPVVAVRSEGGRIVQAAAPDAVGPAALRACIRDDASVVLTAVRAGTVVRMRAQGSNGAAFVVDGKSIPARAVGADAWEATLAPAPPRTLTIECAAALRVVPSAASAELAGLHSNEEYAAALARVSGGRFARNEAPDEWTDEPPTRAAASVTLLVAALLIVLAAFIRRGR